MKYILFLLLTVLLYSCASIPKNGCPANIQKHDRRPFRADIDTGQCVQVLCMARAIEGRLYYFKKDNGEIFYRNMRGKRLEIGESYLFTN